MSTQELARRLAALEVEVAQLKASLNPPAGKPWWERISGSFADDPAFKEAMRLGREYRQSLRPKGPKAVKNGHSRHRPH